MLRDTGVPNFWGLRIPVKTQLKVDNWRTHLSDYFDQQLPDVSEFGFFLDFNRNLTLVLQRTTIIPPNSSKIMWIDIYRRNFLALWSILTLVKLINNSV